MPKGLVPASIKAPAFYGLNSQRKSDILPFQWATKADNCVIDDSGRIAARKGNRRLHTTAITDSPDILASHEYIDSLGASLQIFTAGNAIYKIVSSTVTDISGTITTPTDDNWKFQNFNGKCIGFQTAHDPVVLSTTGGSFSDITIASGTAVSNEVLAAFGRLWILDGMSLKYSAALDETNWVTGGGSFDLSTVWLAGIDIPVALAEFNGHLIVFGKNSVIIYNNPWVPTGTGTLDSTAMSLVENIGGVGCIARDSIQYTGTDILFLSQQGLRSLGRTIQEKSMPVNDISKNVNDDFNLLVSSNLANIKSAYSKKDGFYLVTLPSSNKTYYFDLRGRLEDGTYRTLLWDTSFTSMSVSSTDVLYLGKAGYITTYRDYLDDVLSNGSGGSSYTLTYESGWNDLGEQVSANNKLPKKMSILTLGGSGQTIVAKWAFDFIDTFNSFTKTLPTAGSGDWNELEWGIDEWSGVGVYNRIKAPMSNSGQTIKLGLNITINGSAVAIQQIDILAKIGRIAA